MSPHSSSGASSLPSSPEGVAQGFAAAWNAADADALAALFVEDADFVNVVGLWWNNRERIRAAHDYGFRRIFADSQMHLDKVRVRELGEGLAVVHALWTLTGQSLPQATARRTHLETDKASSVSRCRNNRAHMTTTAPGWPSARRTPTAFLAQRP